MKIYGHRGGFLPYNSLESFNRAKEEHLDGVELDVWLTTDNELAVIHGGWEGEILEGEDGKGDPKSGYIYESTYSQVKMLDNSTCKLGEIFDLYEGTDVNIDIEVKTDVKPGYPYKKDEVMKKVVDLIQQRKFEN